MVEPIEWKSIETADYFKNQYHIVFINTNGLSVFFIFSDVRCFSDYNKDPFELYQFI